MTMTQGGTRTRDRGEQGGQLSYTASTECVVG